MDHLQQRLEALEYQVHTLTHHTHRATRRLRWWRGLACTLVGLGVVTWALPSGTAQGTLEPRVAALEAKLAKLTFDAATNTLVLTGANLHIVNGLGRTDCLDAQSQEIPDCPNGLGNLIVGYNELRGGDNDRRTGSHNVVVGARHNFSRFGGLVVGHSNGISGDFAVVSGGRFNMASGHFASVSGGRLNVASGEGAAVSGGLNHTASGSGASVSGGFGNTASGESAAVSGGAGNGASGAGASVSGGEFNRASGPRASVSGGSNNLATGMAAAVSGGARIDQETESGWAAGSEGKEVLGGNFRSP
jgi:hypothetical protein